MKNLKTIFACLLMAVLSIGQVWADNAAVNDVLWGETFDHFIVGTTQKKPSEVNAGTGTTVWGEATITYSEDDNGTKGYDAVLAGGTTPELLLKSSNKTWTISGIPTGGATEMSLTFKSNKTTFSVTVSSNKLEVSGSQKSWTISLKSGQTDPGTFNLTIKNTGSSNARVDDVVLKVTTAGSGGTTPTCTEPTTALSITNANTATIGTPLTLTSNGGNGGAITWSVEAGTGTASVEDDVLTPLTQGTVTVTATQEDNEVNSTAYCGATPTQTITITKPAPTPIEGGLVDEITIGTTEVTSGSYTAFSGKSASNSGHSPAVYAGKVIRGGSSPNYNIQMNTIGTGGSVGREIVSTTSGGFLKRVEVTWASTTANRSVKVYGSNSAYTGSETSTSGGTELGEIAYESGVTSDYVDIIGDYKYVQLVAAGGALNLSQINITWLPISSAVTITNPAHGTISVKKKADDSSVSSGTSIAAETVLKVSIGEVAGYSFTNLRAFKTGDESTTVTITNGELTMPDYPITITADETALLAVDVAVNDGDMGSATIDGGTATVYKNNGGTAALVATVNPGYEFVEWTASNNSITFNDATALSATATIGAAGTITANFQAQSCTGLAAPTLDEVTKTYNSATIAWNTVTNASSYLLNVTNHSTSAKVINNETITAPTVSKALSDLAANTQYDYSIMAVGAGTYCAESNPLLEGNFTTEDYPTVAVTYSENGVTTNTNTSAATAKKILTPYALPTSVDTEISGKTFVGWTTKADFTDGDEELTSYYEKGTNFTIPSNEAVTLFAVYATSTSGDWEKIEIGSISESDVIVVAGSQNGTYYGLSSANGTSSSPAAVALTVTNDVITDGVVDAIKWNLKGTAGNYILYKNGTDDYLYNTAATTSTSGTNTAWRVGQPASGTIRKLLKVNGTTLSTNENENERFLCQYNNTDWRGYVNNTSTNAKTTIAFFKSATSYSEYVISGVNAPTATPSPAALNDIVAAGASGTITMTYTNVKTADVAVSLWNNEACTEEFSGDWIEVDLDGSKNITYTITENTSYNDVRTAYIKLLAPETNSATDPAIVKIPVSQVKKAAVFASLQELVAADVASGTTVTVSFSDVVIASKVNNGIYFAIQKENANIEIYYASETVPASWQAGGSVSGTMTCQWKRFVQSNVFKCWELQPANNSWAWEAPTGLTYAAPKEVSSIAVKDGSVPTQTTYADGASLNPAGMTVTFNYTDETSKDIISTDPEWANIEWTFDPAILSEGTDVTVSVTAEYNEISSAAFEVTGITVTGIPTLTTQQFIAAEGTRCYLVGVMSDTENNKYGNFNLTDESGSIYVYGCLTADGEAEKFGTIGIGNCDKVKVLAENYTLYGTKHEAVNVRFVEKLTQAVVSVSLDEDAKEIRVGQNFTLTETVMPCGADDKSVTWTSSNTAVATVAAGVVTGVGAGSATITVTTVDGSKTATCAVTVVAAHSVTYNTSGSTGTTPIDANTYAIGDEVTLASASGLSNAGHFFNGWVATYVDGESETQTLEIEDGKFTMPDYNVTVTATWARKSSDKWIKVTSTSELVADKEYIIVNTDATYAIGEQKTNNRAAATVEETSGIVRGSSAVTVFTLGIPEANNYTFKNGGKYLYASSSSKNYLNEQATNDANGVWTISMDGNGIATITATGTNTHKEMHFNPNNGSPLFACYTVGNTTAGLTLVTIYKKAPVVEIDNAENINVSDAEGADIVIHNGGTLTVDASKSVGDLTVEAGGEVVLDENKLTVAGVFSIESTMAGGTSGQLKGVTASNFAATGEAYIDITLGAGATSRQWHAFTVPFPVDAVNGVFDLDGNKLVNELNYAIMDYHGDIRATGKYGWKKYYQTLVPGTFYLMTVDGDRTTYRFKKAAGADIVAANSKDYLPYNTGDGDPDKDYGWNGIGNPTLQYGKVGVPVHVLNPDAYEYAVMPANSTNFVVGTPFFYKAGSSSGSIEMETADAGANFAPARYTDNNAIKDLAISFGNDEYKDQLYISASEDALNSYEHDKDLVKMRMSNTPKVAQIMGEAYGCQLSIVNAPLINNSASYDVTLYAPADGTYTISTQETEIGVYLTREGRVIWDLTAAPYTLDLTKGNTTGYGLRIVAAPKATTDLEDVQGDKVQCTKVLINNHVFILRGEQLYDATGRLVK